VPLQRLNERENIKKEGDILKESIALCSVGPEVREPVYRL
jgi:hypothetical protein